MQNDFEKQVRHKMDELTFVPSQPVWQNIEEAIRRKKERRRILLLLPVLFLLAIISIWFLLPGENTTPAFNEIGIRNNGFSRTNINKEPKPIASNTSTISKHIREQHLPASAPVKRTTASFILNKPGAYKHFNQLQKASKTFLTGTELSSTAADHPTNRSAINQSETTNNGLQSQEYRLDQVNNETPLVTAAIKKDSIVTLMKDSTKPTQKPMSNNWTLGIAIHAGQSGQLSIDNPNTNTVYTSAGPGSFPNAMPPVSQSSPRASVHYGIGVRVHKQLTERLDFITGIGYDYYSSTISVGQQVQRDTSFSTNYLSYRVNQYYAADPSQYTNFRTYTNKYHFISVPLLVAYQVTPKLPLFLQGGFTIQQLINTNALIYADGNRQLYQNKDAFSRTLIFSELGLSYQWLKHTSFTINAGPVLQYSLTNLYHDGSTNKHLYTVGLEASIRFQKKNKK